MISESRRGMLAVLAVLAVLAALPLAVGTGVGPAAGVPPSPPVDGMSRVESHLRKYMAEVRAPGLAYAVVRGDRVVGQGAWGVDGNGEPITPGTPFVLGSVSKSFTALAVMQLVESGRVELDAPVRRYVPWLRLADESVAARITVRQLLVQTTGLPQVASTGLTDRYDNTPGALARSVRDLATVRPTAEPGGVHQYSDANYMILGVLVEEVTGESYGGYLRRQVLDPLGMADSAATGAEAEALGIPPGHRYYLGRPQRFEPSFDGSGVSYGFLAASLTDLTHYVAAQLSAGRYAGRAVLSPEGMARLHTGQVPTGGDGRYAMGWREGTLGVPAERIVWHAGATASSFGHIVLVPGSDLAVVVLTNVYGLPMDGPLASAAFDVARILHGAGAAPAQAEDPTFGWLLAGLAAVAVLLLGLLVWSVVRAFRRPAGPVRSGRRAVAGAAGWVVGCAGLAVAVVWVIPAFWDGAGLAKVRLFAPDVGDAIVAVAVLAGLVALARVGLAAATVRSGQPRRPARPGQSAGSAQQAERPRHEVPGAA
ncbi:serine hydrolase domain-containing protein [Plantactinospora sp. WMMB782]|uniref:serine hydrolase domain-containing protein n=1 Tax=Plantactinospora sp. WMMB782 TaxID=3404121 RepID=UPI003B956BBB